MSKVNTDLKITHIFLGLSSSGSLQPKNLNTKISTDKEKLLNSVVRMSCPFFGIDPKSPGPASGKR